MAVRRIRNQKLADALRQQDIQIKDQLRVELRAFGFDQAHWFEIVTAEWKRKPSFNVVTFVSKSEMGYKVQAIGKNAEIWGYVDEGTKPHIIQPKGNYPLKFRGGYSARTAPVARFNVGNGEASGQWVSTYFVQHPGSEAREFSKTYITTNKLEFQHRMNNAIRRAIRRLM